MHVVKIVLEDIEARFDGIWHWFDWLARRRHGWNFGCGKRVTVDERMSRGTSLDLPQPDEVPALEITVAVLELPQRRVRRASMKYVAHCEQSVQRKYHQVAVPGNSPL
jgi:hypothetical protein